MYAIEFTARIKDGVIEIPEKYRDRLRLEGIDRRVHHCINQGAKNICVGDRSD